MVDFSFLQTTTDPANESTYTFSGENFGAADAARFIIVTVTARKAGAATTISSITIGGVSATITKQVTNNIVNTDIAGIAIAAVPTGASGDVVVVFGAGMVRCVIGVYRAVGIDSITATDSGSSIASAPTYDIDIPAGGFAIGAAGSAANTTTTWTGITEDFDTVTEGFFTSTGASDEFGSTQTNLTLTATFGTSAEPVGVFASWAEAAPAGVTIEKSLEYAVVTTPTTITKSLKYQIVPSDKDYTRGDEATLPTNDNNLETPYVQDDYLDVATDNAVRVNQNAVGQFALHLYKATNDNSTDEIVVTWNGQTDIAPSVETVYLQIFNRTSGNWETLDSDSAAAADTDFTLSGSKTTSLGDYYNGSNEVAVRVYQEAQ